MTDIVRDPWHSLTSLTSARIALGRVGGSLRTTTQLELRLAHARARDAIRMPFDAGLLKRDLAASGIPSEDVTTQVSNRNEYLIAPDKGRALSEAAATHLAALGSTWGQRELVIVVSDGLSALAAERQAVPTLQSLLPTLEANGVSHYPIIIAPFGRVKLGDEVGAILGARLSLVLLGERPGLSSPDSLGAYITFEPGAHRTDADRNCISNIRAEGVAPMDAARQIGSVIFAARERHLTGVNLKVDPLLLAQAPAYPKDG